MSNKGLDIQIAIMLGQTIRYVPTRPPSDSPSTTSAVPPDKPIEPTRTSLMPQPVPVGYNPNQTPPRVLDYFIGLEIERALRN